MCKIGRDKAEEMMEVKHWLDFVVAACQGRPFSAMIAKSYGGYHETVCDFLNVRSGGAWHGCA
jgi:hypothetical protein